MKSFLEFAKERYSVRAYEARAVEEEKIEKILSAAMLAPTACNYQPQKIFVVRSEAALARLRALTPCTFGAPVVFVVGYDESRAAKGLIRPDYCFGNTDAAIVTSHMMLEAHDLGLGSCWVGRFGEDDVRRALGIPEGIRICDLLPVGYPAKDAKPSGLHEKSRPLGEVVEER